MCSANSVTRRQNHGVKTVPSLVRHHRIYSAANVLPTGYAGVCIVPEKSASARFNISAIDHLEVTMGDRVCSPWSGIYLKLDSEGTFKQKLSIVELSGVTFAPDRQLISLLCFVMLNLFLYMMELFSISFDFEINHSGKLPGNTKVYGCFQVQWKWLLRLIWLKHML